MYSPEIRTMASELGEAGEILNDELGEWWLKLSDLYPSCLNNASDPLRRAIVAEIKSENARLKADFVETEEEFTQSRKRTVLRHKSEL